MSRLHKNLIGLAVLMGLAFNAILYFYIMGVEYEMDRLGAENNSLRAQLATCNTAKEAQIESTRQSATSAFNCHADHLKDIFDLEEITKQEEAVRTYCSVMEDAIQKAELPRREWEKLAKARKVFNVWLNSKKPELAQN